jgi:hypothetical protein
MINVEVKRSGNENALGLLRRFTKRMQGSGVLPRLRKIRYSSRSLSEAVKHKKTLKYLRQKEKNAELLKLGKVPENAKRSKR